MRGLSPPSGFAVLARLGRRWRNLSRGLVEALDKLIDPADPGGSDVPVAVDDEIDPRAGG